MKIFKIMLHDVSDSLLNEEYMKQTMNVREHIDSYKNNVDRNRSIAGLILLRMAITEIYGIQDYNIKYTTNGKPTLDFCNFSISHSSELIVCVVSSTLVGIDTELIRPIKMRKKYILFSDSETKYVNKDSENFNIRYLKIWTMKESYVKLKDIRLTDVGNTKLDEFLIDNNSNKCKYQFKTYNFNEYLITICEEVP